MADFAPALYASPAIAWSEAAIPCRPLAGISLFRLKSSRRGERLVRELSLPGVGQASSTAAWVGAGEWLLFARDEERGDLIRRLEEQRVAAAAYWAELSDALLVLECDCDAALVSRLMGLPEPALAEGRAARTRVAGVAVLFIRTEAGMRMIFERSYDRHLRAWLDRAI